MILEFPIRSDYIQLDQLLKASGLLPSGGAAHAATVSGQVTVDGQVELRKRAKLRPGQRVRFGDDEILLLPPPDAAPVQTQALPVSDAANRG